MVIILLFTFFQFYSVVSKVYNFASFFVFFLLITIRSGLLPRLGYPFVYQSPIGVCVCHSLRKATGLCIYHLFLWSNLNFAHQPVDGLTHPIVSSLLLFPCESFPAALADGFSREIEWQQVSSSIQDSSQYSGQSKWCCSPESLLVLFFQVFQFLYQLKIVPSAPTSSLARCQYLSLNSLPFIFTINIIIYLKPYNCLKYMKLYKVKLATVVEGDPKFPFSTAATPSSLAITSKELPHYHRV